jgi:hypothetical protein
MHPLHLLRFVIPLVGLLVATTACRRKAPGPASCQALAMGLLGVDERMVATMPQLHNVLNALIIECLTTPFDRAFVDCMRHVPTQIYGRQLPAYFHCLALPNEGLETECILQNGPGRVCYAEFGMRQASERPAGDQ